MISPISFQGTYKIDASKASPLCQLCGVAEVVKYADSVDGTGFDRKNFYKTLDKPFTVKIDDKHDEGFEELLQTKIKPVGINFERLA